jgi:hypothetical protein
MTTRIAIRAGAVALEAELNDSPTARAVAQALPIRGEAQRWGKEIYFDIGLMQELAEDARTDMDVGEIAYWPTGTALCIFFGPTPASGADGRPRAAGPVNPIGGVVGEAKALSAVGDGTEITVEACP